MAETTTPAATNPTAQGLATTEGKLTLVVQAIGFLISTFGALLTQYAESHPTSPWVGPAVMAMGGLMMVVSHYGYVKGRAIVKNAMLQGAIDWAAPEALQLLQGLLAKQLQKQQLPAAGHVEFTTPATETAAPLPPT